MQLGLQLGVSSSLKRPGVLRTRNLVLNGKNLTLNGKNLILRTR